MQLTGPPKLNAWEAPYCSAQTPMQAAFRDKSVTVQGRQGTVFTRETRLRGRFTLEWRGLSYEVASRILYEIRTGQVTLTPRTDKGGGGFVDLTGDGVPDIVISEVDLPCRVVDRIPTSSRLNAYVGSNGERVADIRIALKTTQMYSEIPGFTKPESTTFQVQGDAGDQLVLDLTGAGTITYIVQSAGQTVDVVDGPNLSYALPGTGTYDFVMVAQPSFAGVTEMLVNGPMVYDTLDIETTFTDLVSLDLRYGVPTSEVQATAYPPSLREVFISEGRIGNSTDALDVAPVEYMHDDIEVVGGFGVYGNWIDLPANTRVLTAQRIGGPTSQGSLNGTLERVDMGSTDEVGLNVTVDGIISDHPTPTLKYWDWRRGTADGIGKLIAYMTTMESWNHQEQSLGAWSGYTYQSKPPLHNNLMEMRTRVWKTDEAPTVFDEATSLEVLQMNKVYWQTNPSGITPLNVIGKGFTEMILGEGSPDSIQSVIYRPLWENRSVLPNCTIELRERNNIDNRSFFSTLSEQALYALAGLGEYHPDAPAAADGIVDYHNVDHDSLYQYTVTRISSTMLAINGDVSTLPVSWTTLSQAPDDPAYARFQDGSYTYQDKDNNTASVPASQFRLFLDDGTDLLFEVSASTYNSADDRTEIIIDSSPSQAWMASALPSFTEGAIIGATFIPRVDKQLL